MSLGAGLDSVSGRGHCAAVINDPSCLLVQLFTSNYTEALTPESYELPASDRIAYSFSAGQKYHLGSPLRIAARLSVSLTL